MTGAVDSFSFGAVLFEAVVGELLINGQKISERRGQIMKYAAARSPKLPGVEIPFDESKQWFARIRRAGSWAGVVARFCHPTPERRPAFALDMLELLDGAEGTW